MIVAIDGPAGSGKSTVAKLVAEQLGVRYLDTGAMYRALAVLAQTRGVSVDDGPELAELARRYPIGFEHEGSSVVPTRVTIADSDVTAAIRTPEADAAVSHVAKLAAVRDAMVAQQRSIASEADVVVEGRDIGTVVFPHADVKIFLTASAAERARRRAEQQSALGHDVEQAEVLEALEQRDRIDSTRDVAPLQAAADSIEVDTTGLSIEQVVERIVAIAHGGAAR